MVAVLIKGMRMSRFGKSLCATLLLFGLASQGCAMNQSKIDGVVTIAGMVRVVGNEPFTQVVVTVQEEKAGRRVDWLIIGPLVQDIRQGYQMRTIILEGTICKPTMPDFSKCLKPSRIVNPGK
jgi:hypothetical protein